MTFFGFASRSGSPSISLSEEKWETADPNLPNDFYTAGSKAVVNGGTFGSSWFGHPQGGYPPGRYLASILMPHAYTQTERVRAVIGETGQHLRGSLVRHSESGVVVEAKQWFTLPLKDGERDSEANVQIQRLLTVIKKHRAAPQNAPGTIPSCEGSEAHDEPCLVFLDRNETGADPEVDLFYFRNHPLAMRFKAHVSSVVSCAKLGAASSGSWPEQPGFLGAGGEECVFEAGSLKGLLAVVEHNKNADGSPNTAVNVYSREYASRDTTFANALRENQTKMPR